MDEIKATLESLIKDGIVKGIISGPKGNILICDTLKDYYIASEELIHAGYNVASLGDYGGSAPESLLNTNKKVWTDGALCAISFKKKNVAFGIFPLDEEYLDIVYHC
jgi:hypothetical protein